MRVLLTGGGTGGHVNPALAIADIIKSKRPDAEIAFIGTKRGIENRLVGKEGYKIYHVGAAGFNRKVPFSPKNVAAAWYYVTSPIKAKRIIKEFKPDIVIGTGGYVCYAPLKAASELGVPTMVHESNAYPGLAVKMLQKSIDKILLNFAEGEKYITEKDKIAVVGNPIRNAFENYDKKEARRALGIGDDKKYVVLSYGGSLGAPCINEAALEIMQKIDKNRPEILHIHATGKRHFAEFSKRFAELGLDKCKNIEMSEYIYDMPVKLAAADLVISRAGAMTVTEMARMKKPCIMIPSAHVAENHQYKNAKVLEDDGAVVLIKENEDTSKNVCAAVENLLADDKKRDEMSKNIAKFAKNNVSELIWTEIEKLLK